MSEKIHQLIEQIRMKYNRLNDQFMEQKSINIGLQDEVTNSRSQLKERDEKIIALEAKIDELESTRNETSEQVITGSEGTMISDEQIDELVKEIDYCIGQLKE